MVEIKYQQLMVSRDRDVLSNFDLEIPKGELCVIVGPSGCGKSSLLEATAGLIPVASGKILFNQTNIVKKEPYERKIGYVFQDFALYPNMTVFKNVEFGLKLKKVKKSKRHDLVKEILDKVNLGNKSLNYPNQLSGGEKQRVAIARALVLNPEVLLMDEPLSSLDASLRSKLRSQISSIHKQFKQTIIFVTHDQREALSLATKLVVMNEGKIIQIGTPHEIYNKPSSLFVLRFFNSDYLNEISADIALDLFGISKNVLNIYFRPEDVSLCDGDMWKITNIDINGESQILTLNYKKIDIYILQSSKKLFVLNQIFGIKINDYYTFY